MNQNWSKITPEEIKSLAENLMFEVGEAQLKTLVNEFTVILAQMAIVDKIDTTDVAPLHYGLSVPMYELRADDHSSVLPQSAILENAPTVLSDYITVNKVIK